MKPWPSAENLASAESTHLVPVHKEIPNEDRTKVHREITKITIAKIRSTTGSGGKWVFPCELQEQTRLEP